MKTLKVEQFVRLCGTQAEAAREIGVQPNTLHNWMVRHPMEYEVTLSDDRVVKVMRLVHTG